MAASSGCQGELLLTLAVQERGEDWPAVAEALRPLAEQLRQRARSADECRALYQAICARGAADEPIGAAVDALRAQRAAELRVEAGALEARTERLRRQLAAVDAGERDDIPTLLAMLPPSLPLLSPAGAGADGAPPPSKAATAQLLKMLNAISKHKWAYPFKRPVTDKEAPDYKDIVKQPMDFSTIRRRIESGQLCALAELRADLSLVFSNARLYNAKGSDYFKMGESLQAHAANEVARLLAETANATHLSPEASELLRGAGVHPAELKANSARLRSSLPADGGSAGGGAGAGLGGAEGADEEGGRGGRSLEGALDATLLGADAGGEGVQLKSEPPAQPAQPAQPAGSGGRKRERGSDGGSGRVRVRR